MEAATAAAFVAVAPLTISGYAHLKECFNISKKRCKESPKLFNDAFQTPAQQLRLRAKEYKLGGPVQLLIDGRPAGNYLEFNGEILLVGESPDTQLSPVAAVGGATVTSEATSINLAWQVPREIKLQFKNENQALEWTKALRDGARLPLHPGRLKMLIEHIHLQDMHNKDLQSRVDRAMEDLAEEKEKIKSGGHEKKLSEVEERLRAANTTMEHHKMRAELAEAKLRELEAHELHHHHHHHHHTSRALQDDEGQALAALQQNDHVPEQSEASPVADDAQVMLMLENTEQKSRALGQRSSALEQRLVKVEFENHPQMIENHPEMTQLQEQFDRQQAELEQMRIELLASRQAAQAAEETRAIQIEAAEQQSKQQVAELEQLRAEVLARRQVQALEESERQAKESKGENDFRANDPHANEQSVQMLMARVMEAETKAAELRVAAEQCEDQAVELERLRTEVQLSREAGAGGASRGELQEAMKECERQAAELEHLHTELMMKQQEKNEAEELCRQLSDTPASELLARLKEAEATMAQLQAVSDAKERRVVRLESMLTGSEEALLQRATDAEAKAEQFQRELQHVKGDGMGTQRLMLENSSSEKEALMRRAADAEVKLGQYQLALEERDRELERFRGVLVETEDELSQLRAEAAQSAMAMEAVRQEAMRESGVSKELLQRVAVAEAKAEHLQQSVAERELHIENAKVRSAEADEELLRLRADCATGEEAVRLLQESSMERETLLQRAADAEVRLDKSQTLLVGKDEELARLRALVAESADMARQAALQESDHRALGAESRVLQLEELVNEKLQHIRLLEERVEADAAGKEALRAAEEMVNVQVEAEREAVQKAIQEREAAEQEVVQLRTTVMTKDSQMAQIVEEARSAAHELQAREAQLTIRFEEEKLTLRRHVEVQFEAKYNALRNQAAAAEKEMQTVGQERDVLKLRLHQAEEKVYALENRPAAAERELPPAFVQRLAASELDAEEAKVKLGSREQELTVARQTIERQRQECEALRLQGAEAMKALDNERCAQQQSLGEVDQEARQLAARVARMEQEKAALQEQLSERTMAYQRELADVSVKMKLLEAALVGNNEASLAFTQPAPAFTQPALANINHVFTQPALEGPVVQPMVPQPVEKLSPVQELRALSTPQLTMSQTVRPALTAPPPPFASLPQQCSRAPSPVQMRPDPLQMRPQEPLQMRTQESMQMRAQDSFMAAAAAAVVQRAASPPALSKTQRALPMVPAVGACSNVSQQLLLPPTSGAASMTVPSWHMQTTGGSGSRAAFGEEEQRGGFAFAASISQRQKPEPPPLYHSWSPTSPSSPVGGVPGAISSLTPTSDSGVANANMRPLSFDRIYSELPASPLTSAIIPHK